MAKGMGFGDRRQQKMWDLASALGASLELRVMLTDAYPLMLSLTGADYGALAATSLGGSTELEWNPYNMPESFFGSYRQMAQHDFVLNAVMTKPRRVMRDDEMIARSELERHVMHRWAREVDAPIEQVMAVMLHAEADFYSGLSLYRARPRPFSELDRQTLQRLVPLLANAVRQCRMFENMAPQSAVLDKLLGSGRGVIVVRLPLREIARTKLATALLDIWFSPVERGIGGLPRDLLKGLEQAIAERARGLAGPWHWKRIGVEADLSVEFSPLPTSVGVGYWMLMLREVPHTPPLPAVWKTRLTEAERAVVSGMLLGRDNKDIAEERRSRVTTVKAQVRNIFDKLGVDDRKKLFNLYRMLMDD